MSLNVEDVDAAQNKGGYFMVQVALSEAVSYIPGCAGLGCRNVLVEYAAV
jgi:hypothetical protein